MRLLNNQFKYILRKYFFKYNCLVIINNQKDGLDDNLQQIYIYV